MALQAYVDKLQLRQNYRNLWHTDLLHTIQADTPYILVAPVTCRVEADAEKVIVLNSVFAPRTASCEPWEENDFGSNQNGFMFCLQQLACVFSIVAMIVGSQEISEASQLLNLLSDMVYCTFCACMQTQHKIEMDKRDGDRPMAVQQMSRFDQAVPPAVGDPPQQSFGYPPPG